MNYNLVVLLSVARAMCLERGYQLRERVKNSWHVLSHPYTPLHTHTLELHTSVLETNKTHTTAMWCVHFLRLIPEGQLPMTSPSSIWIHFESLKYFIGIWWIN